jgi:hypothetical protein
MSPSRFLYLFILCIPILANAQINTSGAGQAEYLTPDRILSFADWLYGVEKDYARAAGEYTRFLFITGSAPDSVRFRLALCKKRMGMFDETEKILGGITSDTANPWLERSLFHLFHSRFLAGAYADAKPPMRLHHGSIRSLQLSMLSSLMMNQWVEAEKTLHLLPVEGGTRAWFAGLLEQGRTMPSRSPTLAGILSSVVPGLGKMYASDWEDGAYSFAYIALTSWLSYDGFQRAGTKSFKGWAFGIAAAIFYGGNIYGSVQSAHRYNEAARERFQSLIRSTGEPLGDEE